MTNAEILAAIEQRSTKAQSTGASLLVLLATVALFIGIGVFHGGLLGVLLLVAAIFVHECGHLIAMKVFHYKNLKMLFIPFLGAVAAGEPDERDAYRIAIIAAAGPLVGLAMGALSAAAGFLMHSGLLLGFAYLSLLLNAFNLLPIIPLDGGHILNEILFARYPKAELCFRIAAAIALFALAAQMEWWLLGVIGALILFTAQASYRLAATTARLRTVDGVRGQSLTEEKVGRIREELAPALPHLERPNQLKQLPASIAGIWARLNKAFPTRTQAGLLLAGYLAVECSAVPLGINFQSVLERRMQVAAYNRKGTAALAAHHLRVAIDDFSHAIALAPKTPALYTDRAAARLLAGDDDGTIADTNTALRLQPENFYDHILRGRAKADQGDFLAAIGDFNAAERVKRTNPYVLKFRGYAETKEGDLQAALRDLKRAIGLNPTDGMSLWYRGYARDLAGDFAGAAADYEAALKRMPDAGYVRFRLALALRREKVDDRAAGLDSVAATNKDPWIRAIAEYLTGKLPPADFLAQADSADRRGSQPWHQCEADYYIGMTRLLHGDTQAANAEFQKSIATGCRLVGEYELAKTEIARTKETGASSPR